MNKLERKVTINGDVVEDCDKGYRSVVESKRKFYLKSKEDEGYDIFHITGGMLKRTGFVDVEDVQTGHFIDNKPVTFMEIVGIYSYYLNYNEDELYIIDNNQNVIGAITADCGQNVGYIDSVVSFKKEGLK